MANNWVLDKLDEGSEKCGWDEHSRQGVLADFILMQARKAPGGLADAFAAYIDERIAEEEEAV